MAQHGLYGLRRLPRLWFYSYVVHLIALWATFFVVHRDPSQGLKLVNCVMTARLWLLSLATFGTVFTYHISFYGPGREHGFSAATNMHMAPTCAVDFAVRHKLSGRAGAPFNFLVYRIWPDVRTNLDARDYVYREDLFLEFLVAKDSPAAMRHYLARYGADLVLLDIKHHAIADDLEATGGWALVYYDHLVFVLVKRGPETTVLIEQEGFRVMRPWRPAVVTPENAGQVFAQAERALRNSPEAGAS